MKTSRFFMRPTPAIAAGLAMSMCGTPLIADAADADDVALEEIVVTGQRAADKASLAKKREAESTVEVVSADEVGKLADRNVAEAVARLSGISADTDKGEARYIVIRGLEPNFANVTINNQTSSAPEPESRQVKLDDVPSSLIGSITVVKSLTPDLDANAIAGQVDIKTLSAFDKKKTFGNISLSTGKNSIYDVKKPKEGSVTFGTLFGSDQQFGAVLAVNRSERPSYSEDVITNETTGWNQVNGIDVPSDFDSRLYTPALRTRSGIVANFDWRPNDNAKMFVRYLESKFDDEESRQRFRFSFPAATPAPPATATNYPGLTVDGGTTTGSRGQRLLRKREEITETKTISLGGDFKLAVGTLTAIATNTKATKKDPIRDEFGFRTGANLSGTFTVGPELFGLTVPAAALNAANYTLNSYRAATRYAEEKLNQVRVDYELPMDSWGDSSYLKFGAKYLARDKFNSGSGRSFSYTGSGAAALNLANATPGSAATVLDGHYAFGPFVDYGLTRAYFDANPGLFAHNLSQELSDSLGNDYEVTEDLTAGYVMTSIKRDRLTLIPGVRVESTKNTYKAVAITSTSTVNDTYNQFGKSSSTDFFPGINAKFDFTNTLLARAAITTAIGRPDYDEVVPSVSVDQSANTVTEGNPNLKALKATNLDVSLEYYFPDEGGMSVGFFYKDIKNPIFTSARVESGTFGGVPLTNASVTQARNGDKSKVGGLEFAFQKPFTFLPSPFDGFGINFNLTLLKGKTHVPNRTDELPLFKQAKSISNTQIYYEKYGFFARIAYATHSEYLLFVGDKPKNDVYFGSQGIFSARVAYNVTKGLQLFVEGNNLNDELDHSYAQIRSRVTEAEQYGKSYRFGASYTF